MHYKSGRQNHDFQIAHFLVGACHTADAAYALLKDQFEDRDNALKMLVGSKLREQAKRLKAEALIAKIEGKYTDMHTKRAPEDECAILEARADIADIDAMATTTQKNVEAAEAERDFLQTCIDRLQAYRKYGHLTDAQAAQAAQRDEWRFELMRRAENYLITAGTIPHDHYNTMRMHPDFDKVLHPYVTNVTQLVHSGKAAEALEMGKQYGGINVIETLGLAYEPVEEVKLLPAPQGKIDFSRRG